MSRGGRIDPMQFPEGALDADARIDIATAESFPASDPPSWNGGLEPRPGWRITRIVAATDLDDCSRNALSHAIALARASGGGLTVLHASEPAPRYSDLYRSTNREPGARPRYADLYADAFDPAVAPPADHEEVAAFERAHHDQLLNVPRVVRMTIPGEPVATILETARTTEASLVVMGSHRRTAVAGAILGSTTDAVIRRSGLPVLSIPCAAPQGIDGAVVAVLDEPDFEVEVRRHATGIAAVLAAPLRIVRVANDGLVDRSAALQEARLVVIAFPRDATREVSRRDPNVRVLLRSAALPVLTVPCRDS